MNLDLNLKYPKFILPAINDKAHYVVVPAGRQTGKSYNFAQWIVEETLDLGCPSLWVDTIHTNIDKYVERYFKHILKPILPYCDYNEKKKILKLPRGYIDFGSAQKPENLEGFNYKRAVLNEAGHILKKESLWYNTLEPMLKADDNMTRIIGTPKGQNTFYELYRQGLVGDSYIRSYLYTVYDSPFWTPEQIERKRRKTPELIWNQEYMASFEAFAGMIYPDFKEEIHVKLPPERKLTDIFFIVLDPGWEHPTGCILAKEDTDRNLFIIDEFREKHLTAKDISGYISGMLARNQLESINITDFIIDPASKGTDQTSGQSILFQLQELGWPFRPGNNDVMAGISRVTRLLREKKLFISPRCPKTKQEIRDYHWKEYPDGTYGMNPAPYKVGDDLVDPVRYLAQSRPDYFEHPELDIYNRIVQEPDDIDYVGDEEDSTMDVVGSGEGDLF